MTLRQSVPGVALPPGVALAWYDELDSTNEEARRRAVLGERGPLWIVAERQSAGRGRQGRSWDSAAGNLAATYLFRPDLGLDRFALLSFVAALAVQRFVSDYAPAQVKWPNDVLIRRRKVAGILLESAAAKPPWLAIGIGINLAAHPDGVPFPATSFAAERARVPPLTEAVTGLARQLDEGLALFRAEGFAGIRSHWCDVAVGISEPIRVRLPDATLDGVFLGLDEDGALRLGLANGSERLISAGDVFFPTGV